MNLIMVYDPNNAPLVVGELSAVGVDYLEELLKYPEMLDFVKVIIAGREKYGDTWLDADGPTMDHKSNCDSLFHHVARKYACDETDTSKLPHDLMIACRALMSHVRCKRGIKHTENTEPLKNVVLRAENRSPDIDDSGCIHITEALQKYKGSQYSKPEDVKPEDK